MIHLTQFDVSVFLKCPFRAGAAICSKIAFAYVRRVSDVSSESGVEIFVKVKPTTSLAVERIIASHRFIEVADPLRFARMHQDLRRIYVFRHANPHYDSLQRACVISVASAETWSLQGLALVFVHEAIHARIAGHGIRYNEANAERIERICANESIAFAQRIEHGDILVKRIEESFQERWWEADKITNAWSEQMALAGAPPWLIRMVLFLHRIIGIHPV